MIDLLAERKNLGLSQEQMASAIGVTRRVYGAAEDGTEPRGENARAIAEFFGVRVTDIWPLRTAGHPVGDPA